MSTAKTIPPWEPEETPEQARASRLQIVDDQIEFFNGQLSSFYQTLLSELEDERQRLQRAR